MKKLLALAAVAAIGTASFALDLGEINGTWQDTKYNANWNFAADGKIILSDSVTGETYFTFTDANTQNFKLNAGASGATITFDCAETHRSYKFNKPLSLGTDLKMTVNPDWTDTDYDTTIKFQKK